MSFFKTSSIYKKVSIVLLAILFSTTVSNCVEPFEFKTDNFESILVISAKVTDELKHQEIQLSRTFRFEEEGPSYEKDATVIVTDNIGNTYVFDETDDGTYVSQNEFSIAPNVVYQLSVNTAGGRSYRSEKSTLPNQSTIDTIYTTPTVNKEGVPGIGIFVDTTDPTANSIFYGYEYEEAYKIKAPDWVERDLLRLEITDSGAIDTIIAFRPERERICYKENIPKTLQITNTTSLNEDRIRGFQVRFIHSEAIEIAERYTILVKQFVQSREAHGFYQTLANFSASESLFSQIQPGFIAGNIRSENDPDELVLGVFDVSSVSTKRIFINRFDYFDRFDPKFNPDCMKFIPSIEFVAPTRESYVRQVNELIEEGNYKFLQLDILTPLTFIPRRCGDCTVYGISTPPEYWID